MKTYYQPAILMTAADIVAGKADNMPGVRIIEMNASNQPTGVAYEGTSTAPAKALTAAASVQTNNFDPQINLAANRQLHFRSDELTVAGVLPSWADQSGLARNATAPISVANQPTVTLNALNGRSVVTFDGNDSLDTVALAALHGVNATVFAVFKPDVIESTTIFAQWEGNNRRAGVHPHWAGLAYFDLGNVTGSRMSAATPFGDTADFYIMCARRAGLADGQVWVNGTSILTNTAMDTPSALAANAIFRIGGAPNGADYYQGKFAEILIYNVALTTTEREKVEGYLAFKYGLQANLPVGHTYKTAVPIVPAPSTPVFLNNAAALAGGKAVGDFYRSGADPDVLSVVH